MGKGGEVLETRDKKQKCGNGRNLRGRVERSILEESGHMGEMGREDRMCIEWR